MRHIYMVHIRMEYSKYDVYQLSTESHLNIANSECGTYEQVMIREVAIYIFSQPNDVKSIVK